MPEPNEYLAIRNLQAALLAISVSGGYHFDVAQLAVKLDPNQGVAALIAPDGPRPFMVLEVKPDKWEYFPASEVRIVIPATVHWVGESLLPENDEARVQMYFRAVADIERALAKDNGRGGHVIDTRIIRRQYDTAVDGAQVWAMVDLEMPLRREYGQPDV